MIRKAIENDIKQIAKTYDDLLIYEKTHTNNSNWVLGVYPTIKVPQEKVSEGSMYVLEQDNKICGSMVLNNEQAPEYASIKWLYPADDKQVLVIHTLCIPPQMSGHGYATQMINYAKDFAKNNGYTVIRLDTYAHNEPAKSLYQKNGFRISGYGSILLQNVIEEDQVYLEYKL